MAAAPSSSASTGAPPSQDAIASLITQVSPTGQPARAPSRPVRPRQGQPKKAGATGAKKTAKSQEVAVQGAANATAPTSSTETAHRARQHTDDATARESTTGTEETAAASTAESSSKGMSGNQLMHPTAPSSATSTPPSTAQSSTQRPSSQDITSTSTKATHQHSSPSQKPKQLQKGAPTASTSAAVANHKKKTKRKSWIGSLFSSCFTGGAGHDTDEDGDASNTMTERKAGTANATQPTRSTGAAGSAQTTGVAGQGGKALSKDVAMVSLAKGDDKNDSTSKLGHRTDSTTGTGTTSSRDISSTDNTVPLTAPVVVLPPSTSTSSGLSPSPKPEIAPEVLAASQSGGTPLSRDETGDVLSGAVQAPGSEGLTPKKEKRRKSSSGERSTDGSALLAGGGGDTSRVSSLGTSSQESGEEDEEAEDEDAVDESEEEEYIDEEERIIAAGGMGIPLDENGNPAPLLKELTPAYKGKKCLVLDLDETLVHSSFKLIHSPDFVVPVEIENQVHNVYVIKRPGVDAFMKRMGELYEVVVFTASLSKYADPVLDHLDIHHVVEHRLFRESCYNHRGNYVKDLSQLGRPIGDTIIIDNSPASYIFHPNNAVPVSSWFNDPHDTELTDLQGFLTDLAEVADVRGVLDGGLFPAH